MFRGALEHEAASASVGAAKRPIEKVRDRQGIRHSLLDTLFARQMAAVHRIKGLESALSDTAALRSAFERKFSGIDPLALPANWFDPALLMDDVPWRLVNAINYASSFFRDIYMYWLISATMADPGARVFAEVGRDHIPAQAAALRCSAGM